MDSFFKKLKREIQSNYGGYCNHIRTNGIEPLPYYVFKDKLHAESKFAWVELTKQLTVGEVECYRF